MVEHESNRNILMAVSWGFRQPAILFAALDLDLFQHIPDEGEELDELSRRVNVPPSNLKLLLSALVSMKFLVLWGGRYSIPYPLSIFLRHGPDYLGNSIRSAKRENEHWLHAAEILRGKYQGTPYEDETLDAQNVPQTLLNVEASNRAAAGSIWPHLDSTLRNCGKVLDVGGGHGLYSEMLLQRTSAAFVTIFDLPPAIEYCKSRQNSNPAIGRMEFVPGHVLELDFDRAYDLVLMNDLLVYFSCQEKLEVLRRVHRALKPGGLLAMVNQSLDSTATVPARWALFSFRIFVATGKGYLATDDELVTMTQDVGFEGVRCISVADERSIVMGRRMR